jgi:hypothetical protein
MLNTNVVWFTPGLSASTLSAVDYADGESVPALAVLSTRDSDGRILMEVKNASGPWNPLLLWFPPGFAQRGAQTLDDLDGNGVQEVGVLMSQNVSAVQPAPVVYWFTP